MASRLFDQLSKVIGLSTVVLLAGCVTIPDAIKGTSPNPQQDLVRVLNAPQLYIGQEARFGGKVLAVNNLPGKTQLEIATMPLDDGARPILGEPSVGRIFATVNSFLEPVDYSGQLVTVVGPITGTLSGKIGQSNYTFVTVNATGWQRWHLVQQIILPPQPAGPWMWNDPYYQGYGPWGWYNPMPAQVQTIVTD